MKEHGDSEEWIASMHKSARPCATYHVLLIASRVLTQRAGAPREQPVANERACTTQVVVCAMLCYAMHVCACSAPLVHVLVPMRKREALLFALE